MNNTATLARSITWASSKQSYIIAILLADKDLVDDCLRAYAYFRWADDVVDVFLHNVDERLVFIRRQKALVEKFYRDERSDDLSPEEEMLADLLGHDRGTNSVLLSFIRNFMSVLEFDARRKGCLVDKHELIMYSVCLGTAVMDGIQYFIGNGHQYPRIEGRCLAVSGAHITHMLRDMLNDIPVGFINIPHEYLDMHGISAQDVTSEQFRAWVRERVELARHFFREGKRYIDGLEILRCKLAGFWYCARFENVLDAIECDGYQLRAEYNECRKLAVWMEMVWLGVAVTLKHFVRRIRRAFPRLKPRIATGSDVNLRSYHLE
jgi:phytoene/squalene synthetase